MVTWQLQEAKDQFSELIDRVIADGPQVIARQGVEVAVVLPFGAYCQLTEPTQNLAEFFMTSPLRNGGLTFERDRPSEVS